MYQPGVRRTYDQGEERGEDGRERGGEFAAAFEKEFEKELDGVGEKQVPNAFPASE